MALRTAISYTLMFLALELPAHFKVGRPLAALVVIVAAVICVALMPLTTLSGAMWNAQAWWAPVSAIIAVFMFVLLGHFELHWSVKWLLAVAFAALVVLASHALERLT